MVRYILAAVIGLGVGISGLVPAEASKPSTMTFPFIEPSADLSEVAIQLEGSFGWFSPSTSKTLKEIAVARCAETMEARASDTVQFSSPYNLSGEISDSWQQDLELCAQQDAKCTSRTRTLLSLWRNCMNSAVQAARSLKGRSASTTLKNVKFFPNA